MRRLRKSTIVAIVMALLFGTKPFQHWLLNGAKKGSSPHLKFTMNGENSLGGVRL